MYVLDDDDTNHEWMDSKFGSTGFFFFLRLLGIIRDRSAVLFKVERKVRNFHPESRDTERLQFKFFLCLCLFRSTGISDFGPSHRERVIFSFQ